MPRLTGPSSGDPDEVELHAPIYPRIVDAAGPEGEVLCAPRPPALKDVGSGAAGEEGCVLGPPSLPVLREMDQYAESLR
jgi:hypothetical protein